MPTLQFPASRCRSKSAVHRFRRTDRRCHGNVLTVAPLPDTRKSDPNTAIQFTRIWSDSQHATVGGQAPVPVSHALPVLAASAPVQAHRLGIEYSLPRYGFSTSSTAVT